MLERKKKRLQEGKRGKDYKRAIEEITVTKTRQKN